MYAMRVHRHNGTHWTLSTLSWHCRFRFNCGNVKNKQTRKKRLNRKNQFIILANLTPSMGNPSQNAHMNRWTHDGRQARRNLYRLYDSCNRNWTGELRLGETKIPLVLVWLCCTLSAPSNFALILRSFDLFDYFFIFVGFSSISHPFSLKLRVWCVWVLLLLLLLLQPRSFRLNAHMLSM